MQNEPGKEDDEPEEDDDSDEDGMRWLTATAFGASCWLRACNSSPDWHSLPVVVVSMPEEAMCYDDQFA